MAEGCRREGRQSAEWGGGWVLQRGTVEIPQSCQAVQVEPEFSGCRLRNGEQRRKVLLPDSWPQGTVIVLISVLIQLVATAAQAGQCRVGGPRDSQKGGLLRTASLVGSSGPEL